MPRARIPPYSTLYRPDGEESLADVSYSSSACTLRPCFRPHPRASCRLQPCAPVPACTFRCIPTSERPLRRRFTTRSFAISTVRCPTSSNISHAEPSHSLQARRAARRKDVALFASPTPRQAWTALEERVLALENAIATEVRFAICMRLVLT